MRYILLVFSFTLLIISLVFYIQYSFFVIPPFEDKSNGASLIMERDDERFFESADSLCMKNQGVSNRFCRISTFNEILEDKNIIAAFSYSHFLNKMAALFSQDVKNSKNSQKAINEQAMTILSAAQEIKAAIIMAKMEGIFVDAISDLKTIPPEKRLLKKIPDFKSQQFSYELETITLRKKVNSELCFALADLGGEIIYNRSKLYEHKYGCYINNFKPMFFYN